MLCTVVSHNKRIVILKRSPKKKLYPNLWAVVGAYPFKEMVDMRAIALREIKDELGMVATVIKVGEVIANNIDVEGKTINLHVVPVLATVESEDVTLNEEHTDFKWLNLEELANYELAPGMLEVIEAFYIPKS